ncbi:MAG: serine/threonine-protein phosphatase [Ectothiorhodospiraceae bacterium]|nr:serine/threonine-protein phosphatase [Ectothiorhodospiraceae bacterium]
MSIREDLLGNLVLLVLLATGVMLGVATATDRAMVRHLASITLATALPAASEVVRAALAPATAAWNASAAAAAMHADDSPAARRRRIEQAIRAAAPGIAAVAVSTTRGAAPPALEVPGALRLEWRAGAAADAAVRVEVAVALPTLADAATGVPLHSMLLDASGNAWPLSRTGPDAPIGIAPDRASAARIDTDAPRRVVSGGHAWWGRSASLDEPLLPGARLILLLPEATLRAALPPLEGAVGVVALALLAVGALRVLALTRAYTRPLDALVAESVSLSRGDLEGHRDRAPTHVLELGRLERAHRAMRAGLRSLLRLESDLRIARQIQQAALPQFLDAPAGFELGAFSDPATETGGDVYDVMPVAFPDGSEHPVASAPPGDGLALMLADATGHGVGAALPVTQLRAMLRMGVRLGADLGTVVAEADHQLCEDLPNGRFVTAWLGLLDARSGILRTLSAGQAPLLRYRAAERAFDIIPADAPPLGVGFDGPFPQASTWMLEPGDLFVVVSDGVLERRTTSGAAFGIEGVMAIIDRHHASHAREVAAALRAAARELHDADDADDCTALVIRRAP